MAIKVILKQDVPNLGHAGDVKQVTPGYFRNYLLPRGLAVEATQGNVSALHSNKQVRAARKSRELEQATAAARHLEGVTLRIPVRLGEQGRIYGSVTNKDIAEALEQQASISVDRHKIELKEPLKAIGVHAVPVKLDQGVDASVNVELVPEGEPVQA
jgi:large subunit ribosomal protein L9